MIKKRKIAYSIMLLFIFVLGLSYGAYQSLQLSQSTVYSSNFRDAVMFLSIARLISKNDIDEAKAVTRLGLMQKKEMLMFLIKEESQSTYNRRRQLQLIEQNIGDKTINMECL